MTQDNKDKQDFLNEMLSKGDAMVCLDARQAEVEVPKAHKTNPMLNLIISLNFRRPIDILEDGIYGSLSFGGRPFKCVIPFTAVRIDDDDSLLRVDEGRVGAVSR